MATVLQVGVMAGNRSTTPGSACQAVELLGGQGNVLLRQHLAVAVHREMGRPRGRGDGVAAVRPGGGLGGVGVGGGQAHEPGLDAFALPSGKGGVAGNEEMQQPPRELSPGRSGQQIGRGRVCAQR